MKWKVIIRCVGDGFTREVRFKTEQEARRCAKNINEEWDYYHPSYKLVATVEKIKE